MRVAPDRRADAAVWHHLTDSVLALGVWTERRSEHGEDAEPLFVHHVPTGEGIAGVFDGAGGAGSSAGYESAEGAVRTGAWVGSRTARAGVESWFCDGVRRNARIEHGALRSRLGELLAGMRPATRSKITGTMRKELPTTMAVVRYRLSGESVDCEALWAGDSRVYALTPRGGLQALTRDHTVELDALEQLLQDPPMTNMVCADQPFVIDSHSLIVELPCVLVCVTDGFFGYVSTPAHLECHLLGTLGETFDAAGWGWYLAKTVSGYTGDDASLSLVALGFGGFEELKRSFVGRTRQVMSGYWTGTPEPDGDQATRREWQKRTWDDYRPGYEQRMPPAGEDRP